MYNDFPNNKLFWDLHRFVKDSNLPIGEHHIINYNALTEAQFDGMLDSRFALAFQAHLVKAFGYTYAKVSVDPGRTSIISIHVE